MAIRRSTSRAERLFGSTVCDTQAIIHIPPYSGTEVRYGVTSGNAARRFARHARIRSGCAIGLAMWSVIAPTGFNRNAQAR